MEHFPELRAIVDSFDNSEELEEFADFIGILDEQYVKERLLELKWKELRLELDIPPLRDIPKRQRVYQFGGQQPGPSRPYHLEKVGQKRFKTKAAVDNKYQVYLDKEFWNDKKLKDIHGDLHDMFHNVLEEAKEGAAENDVGRVLIHHPNLDNAIAVPLHPLEELDADLVMEHVEKVLQSHEELAVTEGFDIDVGIINVPKGSGRRRITDISGGNDSIKKKTSLVQIVNEDNMCMARSIAVCWVRANKISNEEWKELPRNEPQAPMIKQILRHGKVPDSYYRRVVDRKRREQGNLAETIFYMADVPTDRPASLNDISAFEEVLGVNILVVSARLGNNFIKITDNIERKNLYLYLVEDGEIHHFHGIVSISGFFSRSFFCETCLKPHNCRERHSCVTTCIVCKIRNCSETDTLMSCIKCHMTCRSMECFQRHLDKPKYLTGPKKGKPREKSECEKWWKCTMCHKIVDRNLRDPKYHRCGEYVCKSCQRYVLEDHLCYLRANPANDTHIPKFVFFDFECTQDTVLQCDEGYLPGPECQKCDSGTCKECILCQHCRLSWSGKPEHRPNFVVAQTVCEKCIHKPVTQKCNSCGTRCKTCEESKTPCKDTCGLREVVFQGKDTGSQFGKWLFSSQHQYFTTVTHNMKGYDGYFLLEYLIDQSIRPDNIIYNGSKIMCMRVGKGLNIKVVDSLNFLPMKLSALPKSFGLKELQKGWFPRLFNLQGNQNYRGPYPTPRFYGCDYMNESDRKSFMDWYGTAEGKVFDCREEILSYCRSDVDIVRRSCLKFRDLLMNATGHWEEVTNDDGKKEMKINRRHRSIRECNHCFSVYGSIQNQIHGRNVVRKLTRR